MSSENTPYDESKIHNKIIQLKDELKDAFNQMK